MAWNIGGIKYGNANKTKMEANRKQYGNVHTKHSCSRV